MNSGILILLVISFGTLLVAASPKSREQGTQPPQNRAHAYKLSQRLQYTVLMPSPRIKR